MLLLFTSGTHSRYMKDVLNILSLPKGALTTLQYSYIPAEETASSGDVKTAAGTQKHYSYVEPGSLPEYCKKDDEVMIFFIDRDNPENVKYIPIRKGRYFSGHTSADVAYYTVELGAICAAKKEDGQFQESLRERTGELLYQKPKTGERSGFYAFRLAEDISDLIDADNDNWKDTTRIISECKCFDSAFPVFTRFNLYQGDKDKDVVMRIGKNEHCFYLHYGSYYTAKVDYYLPDAKKNTTKISADAKISVLPDCFEGSSPDLSFDAGLGMVEYRFRVKNVSKNLELRFIDLKAKGSTEDAYIADSPIAMRAVRTKWRWVLILGVLILTFLCDVLDRFPIEKTITLLSAEPAEELHVIQHLELSLAYILRATEALYPALISSIKSVLTFLMVLLYGKKEL